MTPEDHNKVIGIMHLVYGGFFSLMTILMTIFLVILAPILSGLPQEPGAPPMTFIWAIFGFMIAIYAVLSVPSLIAGYGMLKKKSWARIAGIIASALSAISFPFGTALAVYSFWFMFGEAGNRFDKGGVNADAYGSLNSAPPPPASDWNTQQSRQKSREHEYVPPPQPPDWRNHS